MRVPALDVPNDERGGGDGEQVRSSKIAEAGTKSGRLAEVADACAWESNRPKSVQAKLPGLRSAGRYKLMIPTRFGHKVYPGAFKVNTMRERIQIECSLSSL